MLLLGYGGGPGSKAWLIVGQSIDFYQGALQAPVSGQTWGWGSWGWLPGGSALSQALKEKPVVGGFSPWRARTSLA